MHPQTQSVPFNVGDHVRYVGTEPCALPAGERSEVVLVSGMAGVVILSTGALSGQESSTWHCQVQFPNGFQFDMTPANRADFELAHGAGSATS